LLAGALFVVCEAEITTAGGRDARSLGAIAATATLTVPLVWRRRAPLAATCCVMAAVVALAAAAPGFNSLSSPLFVLFIPPYSVAAHEGRRRSLAGLAVCLAGAGMVNLLHPEGLTSVVFSCGMVGASWAVGRALRSRRRLAGELRVTAKRLVAEEDVREDGERALPIGDPVRQVQSPQELLLPNLELHRCSLSSGSVFYLFI